MENAALIIRVWEVEKPGQCGFMKDQDDRSRCEVDALDNGMQDAALFFWWAIRQLIAEAGRPGLQPGQCGNAGFLRAHGGSLDDRSATVTGADSTGITETAQALAPKSIYCSESL